MLPASHKNFFSVVLWSLLILTGPGCAGSPRVDLNDPHRRADAVDAYLAEFSAGSFMDSRIGPAIREVLLRLPPDALRMVMDRRRPVMFVDVYSSGTAKFASSTEVIMGPQDAPAFQEGMTLIKISDALIEGSAEAIMGIVAHEIGHRVLEHLRRQELSCDAERETNRLIKSWGFTREFEAASREFGRAKVGDWVASCQEVPGGK